MSERLRWRGKRAGIQLDLRRTGKAAGVWTLTIDAKGRGRYVATFPECRCQRHVCTLEHGVADRGHRQQFCHHEAQGWHLPHIAVFVGKVLRSYGVTSRRREPLIRERTS